MIESPLASMPAARWSACGASVSLMIAWQDWKNTLARVAPGFFPPELVVQVKALACELPATHGLPLSHWNSPDIARRVCQSGLVATISGSTIWRWLHQDAIRPWSHRCWIFPRDPQFVTNDALVEDLDALAVDLLDLGGLLFETLLEFAGFVADARRWRVLLGFRWVLVGSSRVLLGMPPGEARATRICGRRRME